MSDHLASEFHGFWTWRRRGNSILRTDHPNVPSGGAINGVLDRLKIRRRLRVVVLPKQRNTKSDLPTGGVSSTLLRLELKRLVKKSPGNIS